MANPAEFVRQVKNEAKKVTWPTRQETGKGAIMIFIVVCIISVFLFSVDYAISSFVHWILGLGIKI
jgi:preprotein translocase subunit SecE